VPQSPAVEIVDDPDAVCAEAIAGRLRVAVQRRGTATLAVSGGSSAPAMLGRLAELEVPWVRVGVWQVDERVAPDGDADRNATQLDALGGTHHLMPVTDDDLDDASARYAERLPDRFDVVHLGMGPDGHTASWPPGDPVVERGEPVALSQPFQGRVRMTLTPAVVNRARARIVLLHGSDKAAALRDWIEGTGAVPIAHLVDSNTIVIADGAAAALLDATGGR